MIFMSAKEAEDFQKDLGAALICPKDLGKISGRFFSCYAISFNSQHFNSPIWKLPSEDIWCGTQQSLSESTGETQNLELIQTPIVVYYTPSNLTKMISFWPKQWLFQFRMHVIINMPPTRQQLIVMSHPSQFVHFFWLVESRLPSIQWYWVSSFSVVSFSNRNCMCYSWS